MITLLLEVKAADARCGANVWYNPAVDGCKAHPRTSNGIGKALQKFEFFCKEHAENITAARVLLYQGKYEYYKKDMKPLEIVSIF